MTYDRTGLEFCKVHTDISKLGEQCTKPAWSMACSRYYSDFIGPWVYVEILTNADNACIVVIAILDISQQWRQII